jgi:hypothetical protein
MKFVFASIIFGSLFFLPTVDASASVSITTTETHVYSNTISTKIAKGKKRKRAKNRTACFSVGAPTYSWVCTKP